MYESYRSTLFVGYICAERENWLRSGFFIMPYTGCFKKSFTTLKDYRNSEDIHDLNCQNVAKHTEFYLGHYSSM